MFWPESKPDNIYTKGLNVGSPYILVLYVWLWSLFWWLIQDAAKVYSKYDICFVFKIYFKYVFHYLFMFTNRRLAEKYNLFNINEDGVLKLPQSAIDVQNKMLADHCLDALSARKDH